jgi:hypothetical protein
VKIYVHLSRNWAVYNVCFSCLVPETANSSSFLLILVFLSSFYFKVDTFYNLVVIHCCTEPLLV